MNSVLLWIGGLLVAAIALLFAVPHVIDWNTYRGVFEEEATRLLGRDVRVGGKVNLSLLPTPYVRFEKVRISDADATLGESFFRVEAFTLWLSIAPLIRGTIEANEVELDRPVLRLAIGPDGRGNWQALQITPGSLPFVPNELVLQNVKIRGGAVSLKVPGMPDPVSVEGIDGELSAPALHGPYRFRGNVRWDGAGRELRVVTAAQDPDGKLRFKATVRAPETGNAYAFDGALTEVSARGRIEGTLSGTLPIGAVGKGREPARRTGLPDANAFDLKAAAVADLDGIKLTDIALAFEQDGKPQLVTGEASGIWRNGVRMDARLASRWLDLDKLAGAHAARPPEAARELVERIAAFLPVRGTTLASLDVDQINLGGEALSNLRLVLARAGGLTSIGELKASLPGNARGEVRGTLSGSGSSSAFNGEIVLRGSSFQRFAGWAGAPPDVGGAARSDSAFSIASKLKLSPGRVEMSGASVELAGAQVQGDLDWQLEGSRELRIGIDGTKSDISGVAPGLLALSAWTGGSQAGDGKTSASAAAPGSVVQVLSERARLIGAAVGSLRLKVRAQEVTDGASRLRDVEADLGVSDGVLQIPQLKLVTTEGVGLDLQGSIRGLASRTDGRLRGWLSAAGAPAVKSLVAALPQPVAAGIERWAGRVGKLELGFNAAIGAGGGEEVTLRADGTVDDSRLGLSLSLAGGLNRWRDAPIDLWASIDSSDMAGFVRRLLGTRESASVVVGNDSPAGQAVLKAVGPSAKDITGYAQLDLTGAGLTFTGRTTLDEDGSLGLEGELNVAAADAADLLALIGAARRPRLDAAGVEGTIEIARGKGTTRLSARTLALGASRVSGTATFGERGGRTTLEAELKSTGASVAGLLGLVMDGQAQVQSRGQAERREETAGAWPDGAFSFALIDGIDGRIRLASRELVLADGLTLSDADMTIELAPGAVSLSQLSAKALGGKLTASSAIRRMPGGAMLSIEAQLADASLAGLVPAASGNAQAMGEATVSLKAEGRGLNPRGAIATLSGAGEVLLRNARVRGFNTEAIDKTARALIEGTDDVARPVLEAALKRELAAGSVAIGNRRLALQVADGAVKVAALEIDGTEARLRNTTTVDLGELKLDSEWQVAPKRGQPGQRPQALAKPPLPPVSLVWTGPLARLAALEPRLSLDVLEREIAVRKMERDVERLEELRRKDEERNRAEAQRLQQIDDAAAGPGAAATRSRVEPPVIQAPFPLPPSAMPRQLPAPPVVPR